METSMTVFRKYLIYSEDGTVDASKIHSVECYNYWLNCRKGGPRENTRKKALAFRRSLTTHISSTDGRVPFTPKEEAAVIKVLKRREPWPCFDEWSIGCAGFRGMGYHENKKLVNDDAAYLKLLNKTGSDLEKFYSAMSACGIDITSTMISNFCFIMRIKEKTPVSQETCNYLCESNESTCVVNLISSKCKLLTMNKKAIELFGENPDINLFMNGNVGRFVHVIGMAYWNPGTTMSRKLVINGLDLWLNFKVDIKSLLLVIKLKNKQ